MGVMAPGATNTNDGDNSPAGHPPQPPLRVRLLLVACFRRLGTPRVALFPLDRAPGRPGPWRPARAGRRPNQQRSGRSCAVTRPAAAPSRRSGQRPRYAAQARRPSPLGLWHRATYHRRSSEHGGTPSDSQCCAGIPRSQAASPPPSAPYSGTRDSLPAGIWPPSPPCNYNRPYLDLLPPCPRPGPTRASAALPPCTPSSSSSSTTACWQRDRDGNRAGSTCPVRQEMEDAIRAHT